MQTLRQKKIDLFCIEFEPFVFNLSAIAMSLMSIFGQNTTIIRVFFGFGFFYCIILFIRSVCNNLCLWHRYLILNLGAISLFWMSNHISENYFDNSLIQDKYYPILFWMFMVWIFSFIIASVFFLRDRIKKQVRRCFR